MCEQCLAATTTIGEVLPGIVLVHATKDGHQMKGRPCAYERPLQEEEEP